MFMNTGAISVEKSASASKNMRFLLNESIPRYLSKCHVAFLLPNPLYLLNQPVVYYYDHRLPGQKQKHDINRKKQYA